MDGVDSILPVFFLNEVAQQLKAYWLKLMTLANSYAFLNQGLFQKEWEPHRLRV
jgi:hypothetical protein